VKCIKKSYEESKELDIRREKLKHLLQKEEEAYKLEIDNKIETAEQRRVRLETRAKMLREQRLKRREEFVQQQKLRQFRDSCDELRSNEGKNLLMECDRIRRKQMEEKNLEKSFHNKEEEKWLKIWEEELRAKQIREMKEQEEKKLLNLQTVSSLRSQLQEKENEKEMQKSMKQKEVEDRVQNLREAQRLEEIKKIGKCTKYVETEKRIL